MEGEKSKLFYEYLRILEEVNPKYFLLENVASMDKESKKQLDEYMKVNSVRINSKDFTAQLRNRLYWSNLKIVNPDTVKNENMQEILTSGFTDRVKSRCLMEGDS